MELWYKYISTIQYVRVTIQYVRELLLIYDLPLISPQTVRPFNAQILYERAMLFIDDIIYWSRSISNTKTRLPIAATISLIYISITAKQL